MFHEVSGNHGEALFGADQCLSACPFPLEPILLTRSLILGEFCDFSVDGGFLILIEFNARQPGSRNRSARSRTTVL
jgi:hypothetical protein